MKKNNIYFFIYALFVTNIIYFLYGFIQQHDFSNGGNIDFQHIYQNFLLFKGSTILNIDWQKYESTSLPLFYIVTKYLLPNNNVLLFKLFSFTLSLICLPLFYYVLKLKFKSNKFNIHLGLISSIILISSSFRTDAFFGLEENIGFFLLLLSLVFFYLYQSNLDKRFKILTIFFSCLVFYTRQTYAFVPIITYLFFLDKSSIFSLKNFKLSLIYFSFLIPSFYFFIIWDSLVPPMASARIVKFNYHTVATTFGMYIIFILPFFIYNFQFYLKKLNTNKIFIYSLFFIIYSFLFWNLPVKDFGGGPLAKLTTINNNFKIIYLFFSYLGLLITFNLVKNSFNLLIFIIFFIFVYLFSDNSFFSYLDPLFLILLIVFTDDFNLQIKDDSFFATYLFFYFLLLHLSWVYYFEIYLGGIIR